jgi:hypothetical protein
MLLTVPNQTAFNASIKPNLNAEGKQRTDTHGWWIVHRGVWCPAMYGIDGSDEGKASGDASQNQEGEVGWHVVENGKWKRVRSR